MLVSATPATPPDFDYAPLDPADAELAQFAAKCIRERTRYAAIENGRDLLAVKNRLEHGAFLQWLKAEVDVSERTAQNLMAAAKLVDSKLAIVAVLPVTAIYLQAAPSTPDGIRNAIVARIESGEAFSVREIKTEIDWGREQRAADLREQQRQARLAKMSPDEVRKEQKKEKVRWRNRAQREEEERRRRKEWQHRQVEEDQAADEIVALLTHRLGDDLSMFLHLLTKCGWYKVKDRLGCTP